MDLSTPSTERQCSSSARTVGGGDHCNKQSIANFMNWASRLGTHARIEGFGSHLENEPSSRVSRSAPRIPRLSWVTWALSFVLLAALLGVGTADATQVVPLSLNETVRQADSIVLGTVT